MKLKNGGLKMECKYTVKIDPNCSHVHYLIMHILKWAKKDSIEVKCSDPANGEKDINIHLTLVEGEGHDLNALYQQSHLDHMKAGIHPLGTLQLLDFANDELREELKYYKTRGFLTRLFNVKYEDRLFKK